MSDNDLIHSDFRSPRQCESFELAISQMLDGELAGNEKTRLGQHLIECAGCRGVVREMEAVNRTLRRLTDAPEPLSSKSRSSQRRWLSPARLLPAALVTALTVAVLVIFWPGPTALEAGQVTAEQVMQPMQELHRSSLQQTRDQNLRLRTMEMNLRLLKLEIAAMEPSDRTEKLEKQIATMLDRVHKEQVEFACSD